MQDWWSGETVGRKHGGAEQIVMVVHEIEQPALPNHACRAEDMPDRNCQRFVERLSNMPVLAAWDQRVHRRTLGHRIADAEYIHLMTEGQELADQYVDDSFDSAVSIRRQANPRGGHHCN